MHLPWVPKVFMYMSIPLLFFFLLENSWHNCSASLFFFRKKVHLLPNKLQDLKKCFLCLFLKIPSVPFFLLIMSSAVYKIILSCLKFFFVLHRCTFYIRKIQNDITFVRNFLACAEITINSMLMNWVQIPKCMILKYKINTFLHEIRNSNPTSY